MIKNKLLEKHKIYYQKDRRKYIKIYIFRKNTYIFTIYG